MRLEEVARDLQIDYGPDWSPPIYDMPLNPDVELTVENIEEALFWRDYARGFIIIDGDPGTGKTLLLTAIQLRMFYFFKRPIVNDYYPTQAFVDLVGKENYTFLDAATLLEDIKRCDKLARDKHWNLTQAEKTDWIVENGTIKLHGCTLALSEVDMWLNCRRTGSNENKVITDIIKRYRHLDILLVGDCVDRTQLDRQRALRNYTARVTCQPLTDELRGYFKYQFHRQRSLQLTGVEHKAVREEIILWGPDFFRYYNTKNPVVSSPNFTYKEKKHKGGRNNGDNSTEER